MFKLEEIGGCVTFNKKWKLCMYTIKEMGEFQLFIGPFWFYVRPK